MSDATTADGREPQPQAEAAQAPAQMHPPVPPAGLERNVDLLPSNDEITAAGGKPPMLETTIWQSDDETVAADGTAAPAPADAAAHDADSSFDIIRPTLYIAALLFVLITATPFVDRSGKAIISTLDVGSRINQVVYPALLLAIVFATGLNNLRSIGKMLRWPYLAFGLWMLPAAYFSLEPLLSARRSIFFIIHVIIACLAVLLPRSERQLTWLLAVSASVVLLVSYAGIVAVPQLAIHQPTDTIEVELAGDWRGVFAHKNEAGAVMSMMVFMGLYIMRARNALIGLAIVVPAAAFVVLSGSKSSMILLPLALVLTFLVELWPRRVLGMSLALLTAFNVATLGSSFPGPIRDVLTRTMPDVTFTGRTDLWRFAIEHVAQRPLVGYGIGAFWRTADVMYKDREAAEPEDVSGWVAGLGTDSHNGYLDVAVTSGLPGLLFLVLSIVLLPVGDIQRTLVEPGNRLLARFYIRCWLFGLFLSSVESLLAPQNPVWYLTLQAVFGLMLLSHYRLRTSRS